MECNKDRKVNILYCFLAVLGFSLLLRLIIAGGYYNSFDTLWYEKWLLDIQKNGLFTVYSRAGEIELDYPPVYLLLLWAVGLIYKIPAGLTGKFVQMVLLKLWPVVFDVLCGILLYLYFNKYKSAEYGFLAGILWLFNPSMIFNTSAWGQTDQIMCFLLLLSFMAAYNGCTVPAYLLFAVAGLTKYQCLFFLPVLLAFTLYKSGIVQVCKGIIGAVLTGIAVFLPFMIGAKDLFLPFKAYFGGAGKYAYCTLNAFNLYGIFGLNWVRENALISFISTAAVVLSLGLLILLFVKGKRRCPFVGGLLFMQCLFMLTSRMHERYQVAVLPFALMAYMLYGNMEFLGIFAALTAVTALNQVFVLLPINYAQNLSAAVPWSETHIYNSVLSVCSVINMTVFVWSVWACIKFFMSEEEKVQ